MFNLLSNFRLNNRTVFPTLVTTYLVILLIPIILASVAYSKTNDEFEIEINKSNAVMLEQIRDVVDIQIKSAKQVSNEITLNPYINNFLNSQPPLNSEMRLNLTRTLRDLAILRNANMLTLDDLYFYSSNFDMIINCNGAYSTEMFYNYVDNYNNIGYEKWKKDILQNDKVQDIFSVRSGNMDYIVYTSSIVSGSQIKGTVVVFLNIDNIKEMMQSIKGVDKCNIYFVDKNGNEVLAENSEPDKNIDLSKYIVNVASSKMCSWKYVLVVKKSILMSKVKYIRLYLYVSIGLSILLGGVIAFYFARFNYRPVKNLVNMIYQKQGMEFKPKSNEYDYIKESINRVFIEKQVNEFLKGPEYGTESSVSLENLDIRFPNKNFLVLAFIIEDRNLSRQELNNIFIAIYEIIESTGYAGYILKDDVKSFTLVLNVTEENMKEIRQPLLFMLDQVKYCISKAGPKVVTVGIGGIKHRMEDLPQSYRESLAALNNKVVLGLGETICYDDIHTQKQEGYYYSVVLEIRIINFIKTGDYEGASKLVKDIFEENFTNRRLSVHDAKYFFSDITSTIVKVMEDLKITKNEIPILGVDPKQQLLNCNSSVDIKNNILEVTKALCDYVSLKKKSHNQELKEKILSYIENNFTNENLSVTLICENINISPSYLSHFFKEQVGENLTTFILKTRIGKAKELLTGNGFSIQDIARMVGFGNVNTFIRIFKKYEGITPGQYKSGSLRAAIEEK